MLSQVSSGKPFSPLFLEGNSVCDGRNLSSLGTQSAGICPTAHWPVPDMAKKSPYSHSKLCPGFLVTGAFYRDGACTPGFAVVDF